MGKQIKRGGKGKFSDPSDFDETDERPRDVPGSRGLGNQNANAGMMPPSDSDDDDEEEDDVPRQNAKAGMMPPSDSDDDDGDEEDAPPPKQKGTKGAELTRKEREQLEAQKEPEMDPKQLAANLEKLELVKKRRAEQAAKRIAADGWDRYAPMSETNHPPGSAWPPP